MNGSAGFARLRVVVASAMLVGSIGLIGASPAGAMQFWSATLSGDQVVPGPGDPDAAGTADVILQIDPEIPDGGRICVLWNVTGLDPATSAEIRRGPSGDVGVPYLAVTPPDVDGFGGDCIDGLAPSFVQAILDDPAGFFVQVANDAFPDGAIRGQIQLTETTRVNVRKYVCPGSIRTPADVVAAPAGTCTVAARTGDIGDPPPGFTWSPKPTEFDMQVRLDTQAGALTLADADLDGGGTCSGKTCQPGRSYTWQNLTPGPMAVTELTFPRGYKFGWATIQSTSDGQPFPAGTVDVAHHSISFDLSAFGATDGVSIAIYDFRGH